MIAAFYIDRPLPDAVVQRHGFTVAGWAVAAGGAPLHSVYVSCGASVLGETRFFYDRPDVNSAHGIDPSIKTGFIVSCLIPNDLRDQRSLPIRIVAVETSGSETDIQQRTLPLSSWDYRASGHGYTVDEAFATIIPRDSVYASGPPVGDISAEVIDVLTRYLERGTTILDVGCGIGAYGHPLQQRGMSWIGCEVRSDFVERAQSSGLDVRLVVGDRLPFDDARFDAAFANEVLEHVRNPHPFLAEIRRVAPSAAYFSVPNFETIAITSAFYALPWHMLEPDHWNFYTRGSLRATLQAYYEHVEVFEYGELPLLRAIDGLPLYNHLFAVARSG